MQKLFATLIAASLVAGLAVAADAAAKNKDTRANVTQEQKAAIRARTRAQCAKKYALGNMADVVRVEILSDGRVRCWYRG